MAKQTFYVDETAARALVAGGGVKSAALVEAGSGDFALRFTAVNGVNYVMKSQRQTVRLFAKMETAARLLKDLGLNRFDVEMSATA